MVGRRLLTLVDEDQAKVVSCGELLVDIAEGRCEVETTEEQSDRDSFSSGRRAIHDLKIHS